MHLSLRSIALFLLLGCSATALNARGVGACAVERTGAPPVLVELFTATGCGDCVAADRWLSRTQRQRSNRDVLALAYHINYWDNQGWRDPFAHEEYVALQSLLRAQSGRRELFVPQIFVNRQEFALWEALQQQWEAAEGAGDLAALEALERSSTLPAGRNTGFTLRVERAAGAEEYRATLGMAHDFPANETLGGFWAVSEDALRSVPQAGENFGRRLQMDAVVRQLVWLPQFTLKKAPLLRFRPGKLGARQALSLVIFSMESGELLQALRLPC